MRMATFLLRFSSLLAAVFFLASWHLAPCIYVLELDTALREIPCRSQDHGPSCPRLFGSTMYVCMYVSPVQGLLLSFHLFAYTLLFVLFSFLFFLHTLSQQMFQRKTNRTAANMRLTSVVTLPLGILVPQIQQS